MLLLSDLVLPGLRAVGYAVLALLVRMHAAGCSMAAVCAAAAALLASAVPALRPLLALAFALPPRDHVGSRPQPPTVLGVAIAEDVSGGQWPAAAAALGRLLSWAHGQGFSQILIYEPTGSLQQPQHSRQLELQLLQQRLTGAVRLQAGWQGRGARDAWAAGPAGVLTAVLLAAHDGEWPLLAAAAQRGQEPGAEAGRGAEPAAALDAAIQAPARLRHRLQAAAGPWLGAEPDFVLVTGPALTLAGFPAWAVRVSEVYAVGRLRDLDAEGLQAALRRFRTTKQRFGK